MNNNNQFWPEIFITGKIPSHYNDIEEREKKMLACADASLAWGNVFAKLTLPANFGFGMIEVSNILGVNATPENISKYAAELLKK